MANFKVFFHGRPLSIHPRKCGEKTIIAADSPLFIVMKRVVVICRNEDAPNITSLLRKETHLTTEYPTLTHYSILVKDDELEDLIARLHQAMEFMDKSTVVEVYSPDFVISPGLKETLNSERKGRR